ncbi:GMC oxidoreductase-like protein [Podospora didyma]|uniref:GMC oxidoreductase-like protein n=1 Tax=Podospora didyma TaxID=330526 RepID=A0AAE0KAB3_9PEZI|nr:GMC oxidoreductase-like protein [Podospora didyma]
MARLSLPALGLLLSATLGLVFGRGTSFPAHSAILTRGADVDAEYDYIIVGGGTAGLTVADRLTENGRYSVLVIEYGPFKNDSSITTVAFGFQGLLDVTNYFNFPSQPQVNLNNRSIGVIVGGVLGGSSAINGMQVMRGQKEDYDRWGSYFSARSPWSWDGLLPYFKKAWHFHPPTAQLARDFDIKYDARYWGTTSNIHASFPTYQYPFLKEEMAAFKEIPGVEFPPDSGAGRPGAFWWPASVDPGPVLRSFSRPGHWDGISSTRRNYHTITEHKVLKVLFDRTKRATSVVYVPSNATSQAGARTVKARKEIILSAGTIHTPQILQRSGVGPKSLLRGAGIDVIVDLPGVGSNFQDHAFSVGATFQLNNFPFPKVEDLYPFGTGNATLIAAAEAQFALNRTGPLSVASGNAGAFLPFPVIAPTTYRAIADRYEAQSAAAYLPAGSDPTVIAGYAAQKKALAKLLRSRDASVYNFFARGTTPESSIVHLHPLSRGTVLFNVSDPFFSEPLVDYRALSNPADLDILVEFTKFTRKYWLETRLRNWAPEEVIPGANATTPAAIIAYIKENLNPSVFHPIGTSAMMPLSLGGVVDETLQVYGVKGLSVVDASVMPELPGAYTQQTTYAIAEKGADLIKARS